MSAYTHLHKAADEGDIALLKVLLNTPSDLNSFDDISFTPLHYAAQGGHIEIVKILLAAGADVNAHEEARIGDTPLGSIAGNCSFEMAKLLIDAGADPAISGWMQLTALDRAKERKKPEGIKVYECLLTARPRK